MVSGNKPAKYDFHKCLNKTGKLNENERKLENKLSKTLFTHLNYDYDMTRPRFRTSQ